MKMIFTALKFLSLMTLLTGLIYPLAMTGVTQILFPFQSQGSLLKDRQDKVVGSELIAQGFKRDKYFWPRPSAIDYNPIPSGGSNFGPTSQDLLTKVHEREKQGLTKDLLFASASGLDPHISKAAAKDQIQRIAKARGITEEQVFNALEPFVEPRQFSFLGDERVNVLKLNMSLDGN